MKSLIAEQETQQDITVDQPDRDQVLEVLSQYKSIFATALRSVESMQYTFDSEDILRTNARVLLEAYIEYLDETVKTFNRYSESQSIDDIILDSTGGIKTRIDTDLEY